MGEPEEVVTEFLLSYYMQAETAPAEVFLERELPDRPLLEQLLREHRGKKIHLRCRSGAKAASCARWRRTMPRRSWPGIPTAPARR